MHDHIQHEKKEESKENKKLKEGTRAMDSFALEAIKQNAWRLPNQLTYICPMPITSR